MQHRELGTAAFGTDAEKANCTVPANVALQGWYHFPPACRPAARGRFNPPQQLGNRGLAIGGPASPIGAEVLATSAGTYTLKGGAAGDHSRWRLTCMAVDLVW